MSAIAEALEATRRALKHFERMRGPAPRKPKRRKAPKAAPRRVRAEKREMQALATAVSTPVELNAWADRLIALLRWRSAVFKPTGAPLTKAFEVRRIEDGFVLSHGASISEAIDRAVFLWSGR